MKKITWKNGWGLIQVFENGCLVMKLCHYKFLSAYQGGYDWYAITLEQYQGILNGTLIMENVWSEVSGGIG